MDLSRELRSFVPLVRQSSVGWISFARLLGCDFTLDHSLARTPGLDVRCYDWIIYSLCGAPCSDASVVRLTMSRCSVCVRHYDCHIFRVNYDGFESTMYWVATSASCEH